MGLISFVSQSMSDYEQKRQSIVKMMISTIIFIYWRCKYSQFKCWVYNFKMYNIYTVFSFHFASFRFISHFICMRILYGVLCEWSVKNVQDINGKL